ncbi:type I-E CRISPR-associated protein Cas7/Cse4/CasC [Pannonibacter phragmitetus]|uniref:type I-E CRISPR-associated protein Cas7/Cse4/CasC n=1 Tax=Pannonibacter phragmitetus TaxID=121719 RepID=UPI000F015772|nr:type I-E CRISPR-associated protein Cas7/Cse4/CasC [Pannonibacter phragmitetus]
MTSPRFLQIHTLHSYTAALLNRDDTGQAKRLRYGDVSRTRISSQCLKRHWRMADTDPNAIQKIEGFAASFRSRELVTQKVIAPLRGRFPDDVVNALEQWFQFIIYSGNKTNKPKRRGEKAKAEDKKNRPTLLFGEPELNWLQREFAGLADKAKEDADRAFELGGKWADHYKETIKIWRENNKLHAGITAALFGRMVTSDPDANIEAPVHVAHAFTVHRAETENDYFTAVDDLKRDEDDSSADTIQETELTCGLFYGYVVIDLPGLIANCGADRDLAARVVHNLVHLIAEVSPGAKLGSTAPYGRADLMLVEAGDRQPRSLATAYRKAVKNDIDAARTALQQALANHDEAYATGEARAHLCLTGSLEAIEKKALTPLAEWAAAKVKDAPDA